MSGQASQASPSVGLVWLIRRGGNRLTPMEVVSQHQEYVTPCAVVSNNAFRRTGHTAKLRAKERVAEDLCNQIAAAKGANLRLNVLR